MVFNETVLASADRPELLCLGAIMMGLPAMFRPDDIDDVEEEILRASGIPMHMLGSNPYASHSTLRQTYEAELSKARAVQREAQEAYEKAITQRFEKSPVPSLPHPPDPVKKTRAQKKAEKEQREKARRRVLVNTDLRVIDQQEYRKNEHPDDKEVREGMEYLGLNR